MTSTVSVKQPEPLHEDIGNGIKAPLGKALGSLSVNLEEELNRYRRQRQGQVPTTPRRLRMKVRQKPVDLISIPAKRVPPAPSPSPQAKISGAVAIPPPPPPNPFLAKQSQRDHVWGGTQPVPSTHDGSWADGTMALSKLDSRETLESQAGNADQDEAQALVSPHSFAPEAYLASSEELINSLTEQAPSASPQRPTKFASTKFAFRSLVLWPDGLSSPLGIGALLAVLVGSASLGYVLTNPAVLGQIPLVKRFTADSEATAELNPTPEGESRLFGSDPLQGAGPDLSEREFRELNLENLSTIEVERGVSVLSPASTPTASTATTLSTPATATTTSPATPVTPGTPAPVTSASAANQPQSAPTGQLPAPRATQPATAPQPAARPQAQPQPQPPAPTPAASQPSPASLPSSSNAPVSPAAAPVSPSAPASSGSGAYDVVTDFTGDQSLQDARNAVGDAYLRNYSDGARIQLGTHDTPEAAQQQVQELQNQGIPARVQGE